MDFRTPVDLPKNLPAVSHADNVLLLGSCFAENMGVRMSASKFQVDINPFGVLYNPDSIASALWRLLDGTPFIASDLFLYRGLWHSFMHHGSFSDEQPEEALKKMNGRFLQTTEQLPHTNRLMLTWGTAYVYRHAESGQVVSNCHQLPERTFIRQRLSVEEIVESYIPLIEALLQCNSTMKVLLTVSPIRHLRDGLHTNQLSKSTLLLAADRLQTLFPETVFYFPSYEIMMDELRDYRFYADDMAHPSSLAVDYLWECFFKSLFTEATQTLIAEVQNIHRDLAHRPFRPESDAYKRFLAQIVLKIEQLNDKCPYLDFQKELALCRTPLNK